MSKRGQVSIKIKNAGKPKEPSDELDGPTDAQFAQGGYRRQDVQDDDGKMAVPYIAAHEPVERWRRAERLSDSQMLAIALTRRLWALAGLSQRVTANYGERIPGQGNVEARANCEIEARSDLHRIQDYIPAPYWQVYENCVRHGEPAGVAGSRMGFGGRSGAERAHTIVCFVADVIAMKERL